MSLKQTLVESVEASGWRLNNDFVENLLQDRPNLNANELTTIALDSDFKTSGKKYIPDGIMNGKSDSLEGPCVLQVVKVRNIAAPKENETSTAAPPFFKVTLTDGVVNCNALVMDDIQNLNLDTPPGTKVLLKGIVKTKSSSLLLTRQCCQVIGGHVDYLVQKWRTNKDITNNMRNAGEASLTGVDAPPPWVPFGTKQTNRVDTTKKSLQQTVKEDDGTSEFSQARQALLAEAMQDKLKINKTFTHTNVPTDTATVPTATRPLSGSSNGQRYDSRPDTRPDTRGDRPERSDTRVDRPDRPERRGGRFGRGRDGDSDSAPSKPSAMTLFDAIKTKLPVKAELESAANTEQEQQPQSTATSQVHSRQQSSDNQYTNSNTQYQSYNQQSSSSNTRQPRQNVNGGASGAGSGGAYPVNDNQGKERRQNLPPRFQRANDEKERYNNGSSYNNGNSSQQTSSYQRRPDGRRNDSRFTQQQQPQSTQTQEMYNKDDFSYDLNANKINEPATSSATTATTTTSSTTPQSTATTASTSNVTQQQQSNQQYEDDYYSKPRKPYGSGGKQQGSNNKYNSNRNDQYQNNNYDGGNQYYGQQYQPKPQHQQQRKHQNVNNGYYAPQGQAPLTVIPVSFTATSHTTTTTNTTTPTSAGQGIYIPGIPLTPVFYGADGTPQPYYGNPQAAGQYDPYYMAPIYAPIHPHHHHHHHHMQPQPLLPLPPQVPLPPQQPSVQQQQQDNTNTNKNTEPSANKQQPQINDNNNNLSNTSDKNNNNKNSQNTRLWKKGDQCYAKYYDNKFYPAYIESIEKGSNSCFVTYIGYNEGAEVKLFDIKPYASKDGNATNVNTNGQSGTVSARR